MDDAAGVVVTKIGSRKSRMKIVVKSYSFAPYMKWTGNPAVSYVEEH
jgi:hypothetical protein